MFSSGTKELITFSIVVKKISGSTVEQLSKSNPNTEYRIGWIRGKKDDNRGTTNWAKAVGSSIEFNSKATIKTMMVAKKPGTYETKALRIVVEERDGAKGDIKEFGSVNINLAEYAKNAPPASEEQRFPIQHGTMTVRLSLIIGPKAPAQPGSKDDNDDAMSLCSDAECKPSQPIKKEIPAPAPPLPTPQPPAAVAASHRTASPPVAPAQASSKKQVTSPGQVSVRSMNASLPTTPRHDDGSVGGTASLHGNSNSSATPLNVTVLRMVGPALSAHEGQQFRVGYKQAKNTMRYTNFATCTTNTVAWNHPIVIQAATDSKIKFSIQQGPDNNITEFYGFAVDSGKLISVERKEFAFGLKLPSGGVAKMHLTASSALPAGVGSVTPATTARSIAPPQNPAVQSTPRAPTPPPVPVQSFTGSQVMAIENQVAAARPSSQAAPPPQQQQQQHTAPAHHSAAADNTGVQQAYAALQLKFAQQQQIAESQHAENQQLRAKLASVTEENETVKQKLSMAGSLQAELTRLREENAMLQQELTQKESALAEVKCRADGLQTQVDDRNNKLVKSEKQNAEYKASVDALTKAKAELEASVAAKDDKLKAVESELDLLRRSVKEAARVSDSYVPSVKGSAVPQQQQPQFITQEINDYEDDDDDVAVEQGEIVYGEEVDDFDSDDDNGAAPLVPALNVASAVEYQQQQNQNHHFSVGQEIQDEDDDYQEIVPPPIAASGSSSKFNVSRTNAPQNQYTAPIQQQPQYQAPVQPQYTAPIQQQPQYQAPVQPQYTAPVQQQPQYQAHVQPQYTAPIQQQQPQYTAPVQSQYTAPIQQQSQYQAPVQQQSQYQAPSQPQYQAPVQPQYTAPIQQQQPQYQAPPQVQESQPQRSPYSSNSEQSIPPVTDYLSRMKNISSMSNLTSQQPSTQPTPTTTTPSSTTDILNKYRDRLSSGNTSAGGIVGTGGTNPYTAERRLSGSNPAGTTTYTQPQPSSTGLGGGSAAGLSNDDFAARMARIKEQTAALAANRQSYSQKPV